MTEDTQPIKPTEEDCIFEGVQVVESGFIVVVDDEEVEVTDEMIAVDNNRVIYMTQAAYDAVQDDETVYNIV